MGRGDYKICRGCGRHALEVGELSHTRLCRGCALESVGENIEGIATHTGPAFVRWRRAMAACVGAVLLDDAPTGAVVSTARRK